MQFNPEVYLSENYIVVDFETTNIERGLGLVRQNSLLLACWHKSVHRPGLHVGELVRKSHWGSEFEQQELLSDIEASEFIVCHNTKFELGWLARCGVDLRKVLPYCTMIGEKIIYGNIKVGLSLESTAGRRQMGGKDATAHTLIQAGVCPSQIPASLLESYCAQDVSLTERIFLEQRRELQALELLPVFLCRNLVTPVLADIEAHGMGLDAGRVASTYEDYKERYTALEAEFARLTGGINLKSPKQMREFLYAKLKFPPVLDYRGNEVLTDTGEKATSKDVLAKLEATTPEQVEFKEVVVALAKLKTPMQNLEKMLKKSTEGERMYAGFNQTVTQTDRLSSSARRGGMQFQNFDRAFKPLFRAQPGYVLVESDASQLEFRVAADLSSDERAGKAILDGEDVHQLTADILGIGRQSAKAFTFRPLYGGNSGTAREKRYFKAFRERYAGIFKAQTDWTYQVAKTKQLRIASGLIFYWPDTEIKERGYITNTTSIFNFPIQSFATADIVPLILRDVWERMEGIDGRILNTIHDSIIAEISLKDLDKYKAILVESFTSNIYTILYKLYGYEFKVPLGVGIKCAEFWGEGLEEKHEAKV